MTFEITDHKDSQGRVLHIAREQLTGKQYVAGPVLKKVEELLRSSKPHCTIRRVK